MKLYKISMYFETGEIYTEAGLRDVIQWFNETYPADVFIKHPIAKVRDMLNAILNGDIPKSKKVPVAPLTQSGCPPEKKKEK